MNCRLLGGGRGMVVGHVRSGFHGVVLAAAAGWVLLFCEARVERLVVLVLNQSICFCLQQHYYADLS